jgi:L-fuconolactonase
MIERIDSHQHLWRYNAAEYGWIEKRMLSLRRDFLLPDLEVATSGAGISGTVVVQARQTLEETEWLLSLAAHSKCIRGVIGWAPIASEDFERHLERLGGYTALKGLRHVIQTEQDSNYILSNDFNRGISALGDAGLVFDLLILERHLPQTIEFVDRHPNLKFVLNHIAKPDIANQRIDPWRTNLAKLAERDNVYCKVSGMVTEASWSCWREADLLPYWEAVLSAFTPRRLLFGSDWPVCLLASTYRRWVEVVCGWIRQLTTQEQDRILGGTAAEVYGLLQGTR